MVAVLAAMTLWLRFVTAFEKDQDLLAMVTMVQEFADRSKEFYPLHCINLPRVTPSSHHPLQEISPNSIPSHHQSVRTAALTKLGTHYCEITGVQTSESNTSLKTYKPIEHFFSRLDESTFTPGICTGFTPDPNQCSK
ncbi:hypothetical protein WJX77_000434 [Trebouxia sp. C0004]